VGKIGSFRELRVYQELRRLHLEVNVLSLGFPRFELFELGSQVRRSSNSAPAQLAEGWGSRHTNVYIEAVNRAMGEVREAQHHLDMAHAKGYLGDKEFGHLDGAYDGCGRMLERLHQALGGWQGSTRTGAEIREETAPYGSSRAGTTDGWEAMERVTLTALEVSGADNSSCPTPTTRGPTPGPEDADPEGGDAVAGESQGEPRP
jgi:four helix bundle protein